jgi:hypothetical protein
MSQNTTPAEYADFKRRCERQREVARSAPCHHAGMALMSCYGFDLGPWNFRFTYDRFVTPPMWHGSVSYMMQVGEHEVRDEQGRVLFNAPEEGMMRAEQWSNETYTEARDLLADVFGELISGEKQQVMESRIGFAMHWLTMAPLDS